MMPDFPVKIRCVKPYQVGTAHEYRPGQVMEASSKKSAEDLIRSGFFVLDHSTLERDTEDNIDILGQGETRYYNLNQGLFQCGGAKELWYFGKAVEYQQKLRDAVILSDRRLLIDKSFKNKDLEVKNQIEEVGLRYRANLEATKCSWSNKSIESWLRGDYSPADKKALFDQIRGQIEKYMDLQSPAEYDLLACYVLGTYCYELFETFPILFFNAQKGSGKTKLMQILRLLSFNGEEASSITEAAFFRSIESTKGLLCIDEYEKNDKDEMKKLIDQLLNAGIQKGAGVKRVEKENNKLRIKRFDIYAPKIVCNISGLRDTTLTRCIVLRLLKTMTQKGNIKPRENGKDWAPIRDQCFIFVMDNWKAIRDTYEEYVSEDIKNRDEDLWRPILSIAKYIDVSVYESVHQYALESITDSVIDVAEDDWDYQLLYALTDKVTIAKWYRTQEVTIWVSDQLQIPNPPKNTWIGRRLKMQKFRSRRRRSGTEYYLTPEEVYDRFQRRYGAAESTEAEEVHTLHTPTTPITLHTPTTPDFGVGSAVSAVGVGFPEVEGGNGKHPENEANLEKRQVKDLVLELLLQNDVLGQKTPKTDLLNLGASEELIQDLKNDARYLLIECPEGQFSLSRGGAEI